MNRFELIRLWVEENFPWLKAEEDAQYSHDHDYCLIGLKDRNQLRWRQWVEVDYLRTDSQDWFYFCDTRPDYEKMEDAMSFPHEDEGVFNPKYKIGLEDPSYFPKLARLCARLNKT